MSAPYPERYPVELSFFHWIIGIPLVLVRLSLAGLYLLLLSIIVLAAKGAFAGGRPAARRFRRRLTRFSGGIFVFLLGGRIRRHGERPRGGSFVVSNHRSWLDSLIYGAELGNVFVVHDAVRRWPVIGATVAAFGHIFINRRSLRELTPVTDAVNRSLDAGETVVLFPEAATADGLRELILPFRPALIEAAVISDRPLRCAALDFRTLPGWPDASVMVAWADWTPFFIHALRMMMQPWFRIDIRYLEQEIREEDRKSAARKAQTAIEETLGIR